MPPYVKDIAGWVLLAIVLSYQYFSLDMPWGVWHTDCRDGFHASALIDFDGLAAGGVYFNGYDNASACEHADYRDRQSTCSAIEYALRASVIGFRWECSI